MPKVVAFFKAVGAFVTAGAASGTTAAIIGATVTIGATVAASRALKPKVNFSIDDGDRTRQQTVRSTIEPRKLVYGETMVSGPLTYAKVTGSNNEYLHQVVALAGHELTAIKEVHFDDKSIDLTGSNYNSSTKLVTGGFFGPQKNESGVSESIVYIDTRLGAATQTAFAALRSDSETSSEYLATHRGDGVAAIYTRWLINEGSAEVWDEVGNVQNIKCVVQGKKVYDPRLDVNANNDAGDNPTNSAYIKYDDDTLSTGSAQGNYDRGEQGKNPALQLADFLMDSDFGLGIPASKIDWDAVVTAADICDQLVPIPTSAVQKRFAGSGVIFGADTYSASISKILSGMNGSLVYSQGKYIMTAGKYVSPSETLTEDDLVGPVQIRTAIPRSDRVNTIKGLFIDPNENYKMMEFGPVTIGASDFNNQTKGAVARDNGEVLTEEVKLPFTDNRYQAQRLALMQVAQSYHQTIVTVPVNLKGMRIAIGDRVNLTLSDFNDVDSGNWSPKVFKCIGWRFAEDGEGINLTLIEDDSNNYNDPEESDYSTITAEGVISTALPDVPSPSALTLTSQINAIELNWTNPSNIGAWEQIWIYRNTTGTTPTDSDTPIAKLRASSYIDQRAAAGSDGTLIEYYYWIQAVRYPQGSTPSSGSTNKAKSAMVAAGTPASGKIAATKIGQGVMDNDSVGSAQVINGDIGSDQIATTLESTNYVADTSGWQINKDGTVYFQEATIVGDITATSGTFSGTLSVTAGSTAPSISDTTLAGKGILLKSDGDMLIGDSAGKYLFFDQSAGEFLVNAQVETANFTLDPSAQVTGQIEASSVADGSITIADLSQTVWNEIDRRLSGVVGSTVGDYETAAGNVGSGATNVDLAAFTHASNDITLELNIDDYWSSSNDYSGSALQATLQFQRSTDSSFPTSGEHATVDVGSAKTITIYQVDFSYMGGGFVYRVSYDNTETITGLAAGTYYFRAKFTNAGSAWADDTSVAVNFFANEDGTGATATGGNANTLDSLDSTQFLRSDTDDTFDGDLTVTGTLILQGSIDQYNVTDLNVTDKTITVNSGNTQTLSDGAGLIVDRGTAADASLLWDETNDEFDLSHDLNLGTNSIQALQLHGSDPTNYFIKPQASSGTAISVSGNITASGSVNGTTISAGGTTIVDVSQNLTNIGTISSGAITSNGNLTIKGDNGFNATGETASIYLGDTNSEIRATYDGGTKFFLNGTDRMEIEGSTGNLNLKTGNFEINGTTVIDSSRNLTNIGTISSGAITSSGLVTGNGGVLGDPYLQTKGNDGAIAVYIDSKSSFDGTNTLNAPMIEWRESDGTNVAGIRGYVDTSGNKLALGTGFFDEEVTITSSGMSVAGNVETPTLTVNHSGALSGTQVYIRKTSNTNLQRWGEGASGQSTYRFRIDQNFKFIANSGSGDNLVIHSDTGNITGAGTISSGAITSTASSSTFTSTGGMDINLVANPPELNFEDTSSTSGTKRARWTLDTNTFSAQGLNDADSAVTHQLLNFNLSTGAASFGGTISSGAITSSGTITAPTFIAGAYGAGGTAGDGFRINSTDIYGQIDSVDKIHLSATNGNAYFAGDLTLGDELVISGSSTDTRKIVLYDGGNNYQFYGFGVESQSFINNIYDTADTFYWYAGTSSSARSLAMSLSGTGNINLNGKLSVEHDGSTTGDVLSLFDNRFDSTTMYGFGLASGTLYYKANTRHQFYSGANYDNSSYDVQFDGQNFIIRTGDLMMGSNTFVDSSRNITAGTISSNAITSTGQSFFGNTSGIKGTSGDATSNVSYFSFYESDGTTRQGYIGFGSSGNQVLYVNNDTAGTVVLRANGTNTVNVSNTAASVVGNIQISGTTVIDSGRKLTNTTGAYFTGNVGIRVNNPNSSLHVQAAASGATSFDSRYNIILEDNGENYLAFYAPNNSFAGVRFLNASSSLRGYIDYYHGTQGDKMVFHAQNQFDLTYPSHGTKYVFKPTAMGFGTTSPTTFTGYTTVHHKNAAGDAIHLIESDGGIISQTIVNDSSGFVTTGSRSNHPWRVTTNDVERMRVDTSGAIRLGGQTSNQTHTISSVTSTSSSGGSGTGNRLQLQFMEPSYAAYGAKVVEFGVRGGGYVNMRYPGSAGLYTYSPYNDNDYIHLGYAGIQLVNSYGGYTTNEDLLLRSVNGIKFQAGGSSNSFRISSSGTLEIGSSNTAILTQSRNLQNINSISSGTATFTRGVGDQQANADSGTVPTTSSNPVMVINGNYTDGRYQSRFIKVDRIGNLPMYYQESGGTANSYTNILRFGTHGNTADAYRSYEFFVFGDFGGSGNLTAQRVKINNTTVIDSSRNVDANTVTLPASHTKQKIGLYGGIGVGAEYIGTSHQTLELSGLNINLNGASGSGTPTLKMGGTTVIDSSRNATVEAALVQNQLTVRNGNTNAAIHMSTGDNFCGIGFNRNVATGSIFDSGINAFQMHIQNNVLEIETYNGSGSNVSDNTWTLDTVGNMKARGAVIGGNAYSPTGTLIGNIASYGGTSAYVSASDESGRTAFFGVDNSGYAMFGALTNHDTVLRAANGEKLRVKTNGVINIAANGVLQMNSTTVIDSSRNVINVANLGVGTANPSKDLHIYTGDNEGIFLEGTSNGVWMDVQSNGSELWSMGADTNGWAIYNRTDSAYRLRVQNGGDVDIVSGNLKVGATTVIDASRTHFSGTKGYNTTATGNTSTTASTGIKQTYSEGWTALFADYEPYHEWGLYHDNPTNDFYVTAGTSTNNIGSFTVVNHTGNNRTAYIKIRLDQEEGSIRAGGGYYVGNTQVLDTSRNLTNVPVVKNTAGNTAIELNNNVYTMLSDPEGRRAIYFGDSGDRGNYYDNTNHYFRTHVGGAQAHLSSSGINIQSSSGTYKIQGTTVIDSSRNGTFAVLQNTAGAKIEVQNSQDGGTGRGLYMWNSGDSNWVIYMGQAGSGRSASGGTACSGLDGRASHAIRYRVNDSASQIGHLFENNSEEALFQIQGDTGNILARGNVTAYASDERLKTNIKRIERPLEKLQQIRGVEFDWIDGIEETHSFKPQCKHETGVIAQDIQAVIPDAVAPAPFDNNYLTVHKDKIVPLLIEAIKEQQDQIDELKALIKEIKNGNN